MINTLQKKRSFSVLTTACHNRREKKVYQRISSMLSLNEAKSTEHLMKELEGNVNFLRSRINFGNNQILKHFKCRDNALKEHLELAFKQENIDHDRIHILPSQIPIIRKSIQKVQ